MAKGKKAAAKAVKSTLEDKVEVVPVATIEVNPEEFDTTDLYLETEEPIELKGEELSPDTNYDVVVTEEDEDIEVLPPSEPIPAEGKEWVANASLLRKVEGYRDTLSGTLYLGVRK